MTLEPLGHEHETACARQRPTSGSGSGWSRVTSRPGSPTRCVTTAGRQPFAVLRDGEVVGSTSYMCARARAPAARDRQHLAEPSTWGTGANAEAKYLLLRHAFEEARRLRVEFKTDALNERARAALAAIPAEFEGIHRRHMVVRGGERRDSAWYAVIIDDWPEVRRTLEQRLAG